MTRREALSLGAGVAAIAAVGPLLFSEVPVVIDVLNEKKINDLIINPAIDRLVKEIVEPFLEAVARAEVLVARIDQAQIVSQLSFKLGPVAEGGSK